MSAPTVDQLRELILTQRPYIDLFTCPEEYDAGEQDILSGLSALSEELDRLRLDAARLDWLEQQEGSGLISDDGGRWAVSSSGMQNVPEEEPIDISTSFFVEKNEWKPSVRDAVDAVMKGDE